MLKHILKFTKNAMPGLSALILLISSPVSYAALDASAKLTITLGNSATPANECTAGSCFGMEVFPGSIIWTQIESNTGLILGTVQAASGSHSGLPDGSESPNVDKAWGFFGNTGLHQTTVAPTIISDDGAGNVVLGFTGWSVTWNTIADIPMSGGAHTGGVDGQAVMTCSGTCTAGDTYTIVYKATVPAGDPSNFGNVQYSLNLRGTVEAPTYGNGNAAAYNITSPVDADSATFGSGTVTPGTVAQGVANVTGSDLTSAQAGIDAQINPDDGQQCVGGCFDFVVTGIIGGAGAAVDIVLPMSAPIPANAVYRKLINGQWVDFDTTTDLIGSAAKNAGACQSPDGTFDIGLVAGNDCLYLRITDGGPNDADGTADGDVMDPGGIAVKGTPVVVIAAHSTDGCSMSGNSVSLFERADWLLLAGFMIWIGLVARKKQA